MPLDLIDRLIATAATLRATMESGDSGKIEAATAQFRAAIEAVQQVDAWRADPRLKDRLKTLLPELEASRMLACLLSDMTGQAHLAAASRSRDARQPLYTRKHHG